MQRGVYKKIFGKEKKAHWLDYAEDKCDKQLIKDTKILMELIYLFTPTILFWALYEQQVCRTQVYLVFHFQKHLYKINKPS